MPVGNVRPETIVLVGPFGPTCTIAPVPGVGPPAAVLISSAYSLPCRKASPRTFSTPVARTLRVWWPVGQQPAEPQADGGVPADRCDAGVEMVEDPRRVREEFLRGGGHRDGMRVAVDEVRAQ